MFNTRRPPTIALGYQPGHALFSPLERLAFHVLLRAVEDARSGYVFTTSEVEDLRPWCTLAGVRLENLRRTLRLAAAGRLPALKLMAFSGEQDLGRRVREFGALHAATR